jgi:hypothetical protein
MREIKDNHPPFHPHIVLLQLTSMVTAWSDNRSCLHDEHERVARHALTNTEDACKDVRSRMMTRDDLSNAIVLDDVVITKPQ